MPSKNYEKSSKLPLSRIVQSTNLPHTVISFWPSAARKEKHMFPTNRRFTRHFQAIIAAAVLSMSAHAEQSASRIGVVNFGQIFKSYQKIGEMMQAVNKQFEVEAASLEKDHNSLIARREVLNSDPRKPDSL